MPSGWEWAILVLIALLLIGGAWLPGLGRGAVRAEPGAPSLDPAASSADPDRN